MKPVVEWSSADHQAALARIDRLMDAVAGTPEAEELARLGEMVASYERAIFSGPKRSLIDWLRDLLQPRRRLE